MAKSLGKRFYINLRENIYSGDWSLVLMVTEELCAEPNLETWVQALRDRWPEIQEILKEDGLKLGPKLKKKLRSWVRDHTKLKWKVFVRDNYTCKLCGIREDLEVDHIKPITKGGKDNLKNLQTLCKRCNVKKGNKWPLLKSKKDIRE